MKKLFVIFLLITPYLLFAENYVNEFPIYVHGDVRPIAAVFNAIAMVTGHGIYKTMIWFGAISSILAITFSLIFRADMGGAAKTGVFLVGSMSILLVPVDVHIIDKRVDRGLISFDGADKVLGYEKVSNVPYLTALAPSIATTVSSEVITLIEDAFKGSSASYPGMEDIGNIGFETVGFGNSFKIINRVTGEFTIMSVDDKNAPVLSSNFMNYVESCILPSTKTNPAAKKALVAPNKEIFTALNPDTLKISPALEVTDSAGTIKSCKQFYTQDVIPLVTSMQTATKKRVEDITGVDDISKLKGIDKIALTNMSSSVFASTVSPLVIYAMNAATVPLIKSSINNFFRGTEVSGMDVANQITGAATTVNLQTEGLGRMKWTMEIIPFAMHFLFAVIVASSILSLIFLMARGYIGGLSVAKNYFTGFIQFESIRISMALVNNMVLFYASIHAVDKLAQFGGNALSLTSTPSYLNYIATMEGVMGTVGLSAIFLIPMIVFKGDLSMATSAMQGLSNKYIGNDAKTAAEKTKEAIARDKGINNLMQDQEAMDKLNKMGITVPSGRMPVEYLSSVMSGMKDFGVSAGNMLNMDKANSYSKGAMKETSAAINKTAGFGETASLNSVNNVAHQDGQTMGHTTNATDGFRSDSKNGWDAKKVGRGQALSQLQKDLKSIGVNNGVSDSEVEKFSKGSLNQGRIDANKTLGAGNMTLTKADMSAIQSTVQAGIESEIGKGQAIQKNKADYGSDVYKEASRYGERSNISKTMAKLKAQSTEDEAVQIDKAEAGIKAHQQKSSVEAYRDKKVLNSNGEVTSAGAKIISDQVAGGVKASIEEVKTANANYNGGYQKFAQDSAVNKASTSMTSLDAKKTAGEINSDGSLSAKGRASLSNKVAREATSGIQQAEKFNNQSEMNKLVNSMGQNAYDRVLNESKASGDNILQASKKANDARNAIFKEFARGEAVIENGKLISDAKRGMDMAMKLGEGEGNIYTGRTGANFGGANYSMQQGQVSSSVSNGSNVNTEVSSRSGTNSSVNNSRKYETGELIKNHQSYNQAANFHNTKKAFDENKQIKMDKNGNALPFAQQSKEAQEAFLETTGSTEFNKEVMSNAIPEAATVLGSLGTAGLATVALNSFTGNPIGKATKAVFNKLRNKGSSTSNSVNVVQGKSSNSSNSSTNSTSNTQSNNGFKNQHSDSFNNFSNDSISGNKNQVFENMTFSKPEEFKATGMKLDHPNVKTNFFQSRMNAVADAVEHGKGFMSKAILGAAALGFGTVNETFANTLNSVDLFAAQDLGKGSDIVPKMNGNYSGVPEGMKAYYSSPAASNAILNGNMGVQGENTGIQQRTQEFAQMLRDPMVQQEFNNIQQFSKLQPSIANDNSSQMMMNTKVDDISNTLRRNDSLGNGNSKQEPNLAELMKEIKKAGRMSRKN